MQEKKFIKIVRIAKIIQLFFLLGIELAFFLILTCDATLSREIYSNRALFTLCFFTWLTMLFSLLWLLFDISRLRSFASESHALNQAAYLDNLTGIPNRYSLDVFSAGYTTPESLSHLACAMLTIDSLKEINDNCGHPVGDLVIRDFCTLFEEVGDAFGFVSRNGGNQFIALFDNCTEASMAHFFDTLDKRVSLYNKEHTQTEIRLRSACTLCYKEPMQTFTQLLTVTYNKLSGNI